MRPAEPLLSCPAQPRYRLLCVANYASPVCKIETHHQLRAGQSVPRSEKELTRCGRVVLVHASAICILQTQIVLSGRMVLQCGTAIPVCRLCLVMVDAQPFAVKIAKPRLRPSVPLLRRTPTPLGGK